MKESSKNILTLCAVLLFSLPLAEIAFRVASGVPVFYIEDFRFTRAVRDAYSGIGEYDPLLGWRLKAYEQRGDKDIRYTTLAYGIRKNDPAETTVSTGGVLVSGSSFAIGSQVTDENTFSAHLKKLIGIPVINGAVGGYGTDQIVLRAEQLLPIVKPKILVLDMAAGNIAIAGYSVAGRPKPYYTVENGQLVLHNFPVPTHEPGTGHLDFLKNVLGYSFAIDRIMATFLPDFWYSEHDQTVTHIYNDTVAVTCLLFDRVKREAVDAGVSRVLVSVQYGSGEISTWKRTPSDLLAVESCARRLGFDVIDEFDAMKALYDHDHAGYESQYVKQNNILGHKSGIGNLAVAQRIAAELAKETPKAMASREESVTSTLIPGDGSNLLPNSALLKTYSNAIATVAPVSFPDDAAQAFRINAVGATGEHYIALPSVPVDSGPLTLSVEARAAGNSKMILQIVDSQANGILGRFDLDNGLDAPQRLAEVKDATVGIVRLQQNWYKLWVAATLPTPGVVTAFIQLVSQDNDSNFKPTNESVVVRKVQLERGQIPSARPLSVSAH